MARRGQLTRSHRSNTKGARDERAPFVALSILTRVRCRLAVALLVVLAACGGSDGPRPSAQPATTVTTAEAPTTVPEPTTTTLGYETYETAIAQVPRVPVYESPDSPQPARTFASPNPIFGGQAIRVFLVKEKQGDWLNVYLPARPNGSTGWIRKSDVDVEAHTYRMVVELGTRRLIAYDKTDVIFDEPIAVGNSATPSTTGLFYTTELIVPQGQPQYGPFAWGLSAYSEVLYDFGGGDGQMGIHGTNDPSSIGRAVSNGCIRLTNANITRLVEMLPVAGVPVEIRA